MARVAAGQIWPCVFTQITFLPRFPFSNTQIKFKNKVSVQNRGKNYLGRNVTHWKPKLNKI